MQDQITMLPFDDLRFLTKIDFASPLPKFHPEFGRCWLWTASQTVDGYGRYRLSRLHRTMLAHRYAWEMAGGEIPDGLLVLHTCDNAACVRCDDVGWYEVKGILHPRRGHLWLGTDQDNTNDKREKGRAVDPVPNHGTAHYRAKLNPDKVREIRREYAAGGISQYALGRKYGVAQGVIGEVLRRVSWKHVE